jgi:DNA-binding NtrC family response regulator
MEANNEGHRTILMVSACREHRGTLLRIFERLNLDVTVSCSLAQASDVLAHQTTALIFCDENLPDGTYRDLLAQRSSGQKIPPVVVAMKESDWEHYLEAIRRGAFDAIRRPFTPTDVELVLIHADCVEYPGAAFHLTSNYL